MSAVVPISQCDECKAYTWPKDEKPRHAIECSHTSLEERAANYKALAAGYLKSQARHNTAMQKAHEQTTYWQGKFAAVKHENNQLRHKLSKP